MWQERMRSGKVMCYLEWGSWIRRNATVILSWDDPAGQWRPCHRSNACMFKTAPHHIKSLTSGVIVIFTHWKNMIGWASKSKCNSVKMKFNKKLNKFTFSINMPYSFRYKTRGYTCTHIQSMHVAEYTQYYWFIGAVMQEDSQQCWNNW